MSTGKVGKRLVDVRPDRVDLRDRPYRPPLISLPAAWPDLDLAVKKLLPKYVKHGMILNQGDEGACTGFGLAAVVNYLLWSAENLDEYGDLVKGGTKVARVSERMLYHLARIYDEWPGEDYDGSSCRGAIKGWHRHGVCSASLWPYRAKAPKGKKLGAVRFIKPKKGWERDAATRPLGAYYRIDKDSVADMQAAIYEVGAIYCSAQVHGGWDSPAGDRLPIIEPQEADGGHAFAIVGFTEDGFIVQNSWDTGWGRSGFAVLRYPDWVQNGMDAWVAVMGAPVTTTLTLSTFSTATQRQAADGRATWFWSSKSNKKGYAYKNAEVQPWSETDAYYHSVVLGNDGRALNRIVSAENAAEAIETVAYTRPRDWLATAPTPRLVIYAHGGLNDEGDAIKRVRTMAPYFKANGIYPLFLTWRTGFLESITGIISDSVKKLFWGDRAEGWFGDQLDKIKNRLAEAKDRSVEVACEKLLVKAVWSQMRQNAGAALRHEAGGVQARCAAAQGLPQAGDSLRRPFGRLDHPRAPHHGADAAKDHGALRASVGTRVHDRFRAGTLRGRRQGGHAREETAAYHDSQ